MLFLSVKQHKYNNFYNTDKEYHLLVRGFPDSSLSMIFQCRYVYQYLNYHYKSKRHHAGLHTSLPVSATGTTDVKAVFSLVYSEPFLFSPTQMIRSVSSGAVFLPTASS